MILSHRKQVMAASLTFMYVLCMGVGFVSGHGFLKCFYGKRFTRQFSIYV